jgi:hypothetical protein
MPEPEMTSVNSSNVDAVGHDADQEEMWVRFQTGETYIYSGVDSMTYESVLNAASIGSTLNRLIKPNHPYRKA